MQEYKKRKHLVSLVDYLTSHRNSDFYFTRNNERTFVSCKKDLRDFLKESSHVYVYEKDGDVVGIILSWKSIGNKIKRYYLKIHAKDEKIAEALVTIFLWNCNNDLYCKIKKDSKFIKLLRNKGFQFSGDRGREILLFRPKNKFVNHYCKDKELDGDL